MASASTNAKSIQIKNQKSEVSSSSGTISVVLIGRLVGMPGTKVRCRAVDGVNNYDQTKTVSNSGTPIPYYLTCFVYLPLPGEYKLTANPEIIGFRGSSETIYLESPIVETVVLRIRIGIQTFQRQHTVSIITALLRALNQYQA